MDPSACLYEILGVPPGATRKEIKAAYQRKAQQWHPDRNAGSQEATRHFILIRAAFEILSDDRRRAQYDADRKARQGTRDRPSPPPTPPPPPPPIRVGRKGDDLRVFAKVPLDLLLDGGELESIGMVGSVCRRCAGRGCVACRGSGQILVRRMWVVHVPAGFPPHRLIRFSGAGHTGPFFPRPGDVYIHLRPRSAYGWHWNMERQRLEKVVRVPAAFLREGGKLEVQSPHGTWGSIQVPATPASCHWILLHGKGLDLATGGRGMWLCLKVGFWFSWGARRAPIS